MMFAFSSDNTKGKTMRTSWRSHFSTSNSSFFTRVKNRFGSASRLGLTTIAALALVVAVSASSSKNTDQSKKSAAIDAASSSLLAKSSKTVAASPVVSFANKSGQYQQSLFPAPDATQTVLDRKSTRLNSSHR